MLESNKFIRVRVSSTKKIEDLKTIFYQAKKKYVRAWGFDPNREEIIDNIEVDKITAVTNTYNPGDMGWKE